MKKVWGLVFLFALNALGERSGFDKGWRFMQKDVSGAQLADYNDDSWRVLDLPHDWSIEGEYAEDHPMSEYGGYLPAGIGWYRKTIVVPAAWRGKHVEIAFDGVFMNSTVWVNGKELGTRPYGWISFAYDISEMVSSSDTVTFAVRVDNQRQPAARWYTGSGIYAHTWIDVKDPVHVVRDGIYLRTEGETVLLDAEIRSTAATDQELEIEVSIVDPAGREVAQASKPLNLASGALLTTGFKCRVPAPLRWDIETPHLYTAVTKVRRAGTVLDKVSLRFGIRDIEWKPESGLWLNGRNVKLQGVCNHQGAGALGAAVPDKLLRFRIRQLKDMGCNAIRTSHNPQTPVFYKLCDEMGMLVLDELYDGWSKKAANDYGAHYFEDWWRRDLTDWIRRDRNHPSIVVWSVGNETHGEVAEELVALCHKLDATRPVTTSQSEPQAMDIYGANGSSERVGWFDSYDEDRVMIGTENTHTWQVRGFYRTKTWYRDGYPNKRQKPFETPDLTEKEVFTYDWIREDERSNPKQIFNSSYDNAMVRLNSRRNIEQLRDIPFYAGSFRWTGYDYIGEAGYVHGGWPFKAFMGGAIDLANFEKDLYYLYQSQWTDTPMVHILPHWTHPTLKAGTKIPVWVYSNCEEVELFLNGRSLGTQRPGKSWDKMQCEWQVGWEPGALKAVGRTRVKRTGLFSFLGRKTVKIEQVFRTADAPARIALSIDGEGLADKGKDLVQVRVTTQDEKGEFYPYGENRTHFSIIGPARIRALDNGSPVDVEKHYEAKSRIAFFGLARAYVEATGATGDIALVAGCILGEKKQVSSNQVSIDVQQLALRGSPAEKKVSIYYTVDGSVPSEKSTRYKEAFSVALGTTVKALVLLDGQPVQWLEERFAEDEGLVWNAGERSVGIAGSQAETALVKGGVVAARYRNYRGSGYVQLERDGGYVEWYQENDGDAGVSELTLRYHGMKENGEGHRVSVSVNGKVVRQGLLLPNTSARSGWGRVTLNIPIRRGANTIRITANPVGTLCLDEITVH